MSKRKVLNYTRRTLAFLIAMIMTFSVVESAALTTYASTGSDIVVEETEVTETVEEIDTTVSDEEEGTIVEETVSTEIVVEETEELSSISDITETATVIEAVESVECEETVTFDDNATEEDGDETYKGDITTYTNSSTGYEEVHLSLFPSNDGGKDTFTLEEISSILSNYEVESFDQIMIDYRDLESYVIYKDVVNVMLPYLKTIDEAEQALYFSFTNCETGSYIYWILRKPEQQTEDITVACNVTVADGNVYMQASGQGIKAESVEASYRISKTGESALAESIISVFGDKSAGYFSLEGTEVYSYYSSILSDDEVYLEIEDVKQINADTLYKIGYFGRIYESVHSDGYLYKNLVFDCELNENKAYTSEEIAEMLSGRSEGSFDEIGISVLLGSENGQNLISKDIIDTVLPYLKTATEDRNNCITFKFYSGNGLSKTWYLINPQSQEADQYVDASVSFDKAEDGTIENVKFYTVSEQDFKADFVRLSLIYAGNDENATPIIADANAFLPAGSTQLEAIGSEGIIGCYVASTYATFSTVDLEKLTPNTTYTLGEITYKGTEFEEDGRTGLEIAHYEMDIPEDSDFETEALSVINNLTKKYEIISLCYDSVIDNVDAELWNAALGKLNSENDQTVTIRTNFSGGESAPDENWNFDNPATVETDVKLGVSITLSEENGGGATFKLDESATAGKAAQEVCVNFNADKENRDSVYNTYLAAFGTESSDYIILDSDANEVANTNAVYENNVNDNIFFNVGICGIQNLAVNTEYSLVKKVYKGDYNEWDNNGYTFKSLYIHPGNIGKDSFTAEQITDILGNYEAKNFDEITVVYCTDTMGGTVDDAIINATLPYLKDATEDRTSTTRVCFQNPETNEEFSWILVGPGTQTADQILTGSFTIADGTASVVVGSQTLVADCVNINVSRSNEQDADGVAALKAVFGEEPTALAVGDTNVPAGFDMDDWSAWVWIDEVSRLTVDTPYSLGKNVYKGRIDTWDDGQRELNINFDEAGVESFSEAQLLEILGNYSKEDNINYVYIEQPRNDDSNIIYKSVADAAAALVNTEHTEIKFAFCNHMGANVIWCLAGEPSKIVQTADQNVEAGLWMSEEETAAYISAGKQSLVAPEMSLTFTINRGIEDPAEALMMKAYGENWIEIETENHALEGSYFVDDYNVVVNFFGNPNVLNSEEMYKVIKKAYRGHVNEWEENNELMRELYLSSADIQKDKFTEDELQAAIQFYIDNNITFDTVSIQQKYTDNNIIDKDFINMTKDLLVGSRHGGLTFVFCRCVDEKYDESGNCIQKYIQSDMNWHFIEPREATKDINANITITESNGNGLSVVLNSNTYNAASVIASFYMDIDADMYVNKVVPSVGKAPSWRDSRYENVLFVFENGKTFNDNIYCSYGLDTESDKVSLNIAEVQKWKPGIENRLVKGIAIEEQVCLGIEKEVSIKGNADGNVTWKSLDPELASVSVKADGKNGVISALKEYDEAAVMASYKVNNQPCSEVFYFNTGIGVEKVQFANKEITIEWDGVDTEYREFLTVNLSPSSIQSKVNPQGFEWFVDDHAVTADSVSGNAIAFDIYPFEYEGEIVDQRTNGSFRVIGYGTSTVKVKCGTSEDTCVINVVKPVEVPEITTQIFALPVVDKTLAAIDLDKLFGTEEGTWEWKNSNTDLTLYSDKDSFNFSAVYAPKDDVLKRSVTVLLPVNILRIEEVKLVTIKTTESGNEFTDLNYNLVKAGDEIIMNYQVHINAPNMDEIGNFTPEFAAFMKYFGTDGVLEARWSSKESLDTVTVAGLANPRKYIAAGKGLKNFTVNIVNKQTGKTVTSGDGSVFVLQNRLFDFYDRENYKFEDIVDTNDPMSGIYKFTVSESNYMKLTITSGDSSLMKLGRVTITQPTDTYKYYVIEVPYTFKDYGTTTLKVTAADEVKSYTAYEKERIDNDPKIVETSFTIDKAWSYSNPSSLQYDGPKCNLTLAYHNSTTPAGNVTVNDSSFDLYHKYDGSYDLILKDTSVPTGSRNVTLSIPVIVGEGAETKEVTRTITISVNITESKNPSVKIKQNQKLNEFYKHSKDSDDGIGIITIDGGKYDVCNAWIEGDSIFTLTQYDDNKYAIRVKESVNLNGSAITSAQKKITIGYEIVDGGFSRKSTKAFTVKTQNKKPALVLSKKSDTLYPAVNTILTSFSVADKATKETLTFNTGDVKLLVDKNAGKTFTLATPETEGALNKVGKNNYLVFLNENPEIICMGLSSNEAPVKANDKFTFYIQKANWNNYVSVTYTAKVNLKTPSLKLGSATLTLNANDEVYRYQTAATTVKLNGYGENAFSDQTSIWITGSNAAATNALKNNLSYFYDREQGLFRMYITDKGTDEAGTKLKGTYKFKLWTNIDGVKLSTNLTVKIVDKPLSKAVKTVKKGSIDVLTRDTAYMTMNPKLSNLSGDVFRFELKGPDADLFDAYVDENGNCVVKAKYDEYDEEGNLLNAYVYSTKTTYRVTPVYYIVDNGVYEVNGTTQSFKVKQGKPKLTISTTGNVLYGKRDSSINLYFGAVLKDQDISISKVELLNYNYDLNWENYGNSGTLTVNEYMYQITKAKGNYKLKFAVTYTDKAGNEKVAQTTYKVTVLRK